MSVFYPLDEPPLGEWEQRYSGTPCETHQCYKFARRMFETGPYCCIECLRDDTRAALPGTTLGQSNKPVPDGLGWIRKVRS